jgi:hypothetical protein
MIGHPAPLRRGVRSSNHDRGCDRRDGWVGHARQISGDYRSGSHNRVLLFDRRHCIGVIYIDINIIDDVYFSEIQVFYDPRHDGPRLDSNDEGDARPDKVRSRWY